MEWFLNAIQMREVRNKSGIRARADGYEVSFTHRRVLDDFPHINSHRSNGAVQANQRTNTNH